MGLGEMSGGGSRVLWEVEKGWLGGGGGAGVDLEESRRGRAPCSWPRLGRAASGLQGSGS